MSPLKDGVSQNFGFIETNSITPFKNMYAFGSFYTWIKKAIYSTLWALSILSPIISFDIKHSLSRCSSYIVLGSKVRVTPVIFQVIYITHVPEDTLFADRINSLLIRLGPSIVFPFPALGNFIKWNFEKP